MVPRTGTYRLGRAEPWPRASSRQALPSAGCDLTRRLVAPRPACARPRRRPAAARLLRRLAVAVPRLRHRGRDAHRGRVHAAWPRTRRGPATPAATSSSAAAASSPGRSRPARSPTTASASSAPTPTAPTCASSPSPTWSAPACRAARRRGLRRRAAQQLARPRPGPVGPGGGPARRSGGAIVRLLRVDRPVCCIPQLAIHLDREVTTKGLRRQPPAAPAPRSGASATGDDEGEFRGLRGRGAGRGRRRRPRLGPHAPRPGARRPGRAATTS